MQIDEILQTTQSRNIQNALQFWNWSRQGKQLPAREDINLTEIPSLLLGLTLLDVVDGGQDYRVRYVGRNIINNQTLKVGQLQSEMPAQEGRTLIRKRYQRVLDERRPVLQRYVYTSFRGDSRLIEAVTCPLSDDGITINKLFSYGIDHGFTDISEEISDTLI
ncbi:MAG: PAS domain-containing protein [Rhodospirillales bacterium]